MPSFIYLSKNKGAFFIRKIFPGFGMYYLLTLYKNTDIVIQVSKRGKHNLLFKEKSC